MPSKAILKGGLPEAQIETATTADSQSLVDLPTSR